MEKPFLAGFNLLKEVELMALLARIFVVLAAVSFVIGIILRLTRAVFPIADLAPVAFLRFTDTSLLFAIALMVLVVVASKTKA